VISITGKAMLYSFEKHWPEYLIEAWCLGTFMLSACGFGVLLFHPDSPAIGLGHGLRNVLMGLAMGATATAIICWPWGRRSGAHYNPAVTLSFLRLGKIKAFDAFFYIVFQFIGGALGVLLAWAVFGSGLEHAAVNFVVTMPGTAGVEAAAAAEFVIAFILMSTVLIVSNSARASKLTPFFAGTLVALFIAIESPVSGMSMNPARTFGSAVIAGEWNAWWIYFIVPPIAMLTAAELYVRLRGMKAVLCAKLDHGGRSRCIFNCGFAESSGDVAAAMQKNSGYECLNRGEHAHLSS
jgi:aquaporin Z